jgi:GTP-binding protein Era
MAEHRAGFVTLIGRPNAGKSTLLNAIVGRKISITSSKPQTTRHRIVGVHSSKHCQYIFVDTPGLHEASGRTINKIITRTARSSLAGVDAVVMLVDCRGWNAQDRYVLNSLKDVSLPLILVISKIDMLKDKSRLLPLIDESSRLGVFQEIVPVSATSGTNVDQLLTTLSQYLPAGPMYYPEGQNTDRSHEFMVSELIREQVFRQLGQELPYETAVRVVNMSDGDPVLIEAQIWVDRPGQKGMVVGKDGHRIKNIGVNARKSIEQCLGKRTHLDIVVKVRKGWADNQADLHSLGYTEES